MALNVELLNRVVILFLGFEAPPSCLPQQLCFYFPINDPQGVQSLHMLTKVCYFLVFFFFFESDNYNEHEVVFHNDFDLHPYDK